MQIHELPVIGTAADADVLAVDNGSTTQKITVGNLGKKITEDAAPAFTSGDAASPTAWTAVNTVTSGTALKTVLNSLTTMMKNVRYLYRLISGLTAQTETFSDTAVSTSATTNLGSFTLPAGKWIILAVASFGGNATGYRAVGISSSTSTLHKDRYSLTRAGNAATAAASLQVMNLVNIASSTTFYINVYQTSGAELTCSGGYVAYKIL